MDEVWAAIKRNQADVRQPQSDHFTVGGLLEGIGVIPGEEGAAGGLLVCTAGVRGHLRSLPEGRGSMRQGAWQVTPVGARCGVGVSQHWQRDCSGWAVQGALVSVCGD